MKKIEKFLKFLALAWGWSVVAFYTGFAGLLLAAYLGNNWAFETAVKILKMGAL